MEFNRTNWNLLLQMSKRRNYDTFPQFYRKYDIVFDFPALIAAICPGMQLAPKREMAAKNR